MTIQIGKEILKQGYALLQKDRFEEADAVYARMPVSDLEYYQALRQRGVIAAMQRNLEKAISFLQQATAASNDSESHRHLAMVYYSRGDFELAYRHYVRALAIEPFNVNARLGVEATSVKMPSSTHWYRIVMCEEGKKLIKALGSGLDVLEISGFGWNDREFQFNSYLSTSIAQYNVCKEPFPSNKFDLVILDQILEHVRWPTRALKNVLDSLKANGACFVTTPFLIRNHPDPEDFWRFTEHGLRCVLEDAGFPSDKIQSGSWGNRACVVANFERWEVYDLDSHSLKNEKDYPVTVWALARL